MYKPNEKVNEVPKEEKGKEENDLEPVPEANEPDSDFDRDSTEGPIGQVAVWAKSIKPAKQKRWFMFGQTSARKSAKIVDNDNHQQDSQLEFLIKQMQKDPLLRDLIQHEVVLAVLNSS